MVLFRAMLILALVAASATTQTCERCSGSGSVACDGKEHDGHESCGVDFEHECTTVLRARCCRGLKLAACPDCRGAAQELLEKREARKAWVREVTKLDLAIGKPFTHVQTKHFVVHCTIEEWRVPGRGKISRNQLTHLIAERLEDSAVAFEKIVGVLPDVPQDAYVVWDREQCIRTSRQIDEKPIEGCHHSLTRKNAFWIGYPFHTSLYTDRGLHSYIVHNGIHMLLNGVLRLKPAPCWFQMGLASHVTHKKFHGDKVDTHLCSPFVDAHPLRASRSWKKFVKKEISRDREIELKDLEVIDDVLKTDYRQHAYAWTYASFLIDQGPDNVREFIALTKRGYKSGDAIEKIFGWTPEEFQKRWRRFVARGLK